MNLIKVPLNSSYLTLYVDNECGVVYHHIQQSLYCLCPLSLSLFIALDEFSSERQAITFVKEQNDVPDNQIQAALKQVKLLFQQDLPAISYKDGQYPELVTKGTFIEYPLNHNCFICSVDKLIFAFRVSNNQLFHEISSLLKPIAAHLEDRHVDGSVPVDFKFELTDTELGITFSCNTMVLESALTYEQVMPHVIDRMQILTFQDTDFQYCFHGAAIKKAQHVILLPGSSGAGKSTLTATLAAHGYQVFSDEMIVMDGNYQLLSIPLPIAIKSGSWSVLCEDYPELDKLSTWQREDGRMLKYVWPKQFSTDNSYQDLTVINPDFSAESKHNLTNFQCRELSLIATIRMLTESGYQVHEQLLNNEVEQLFEFLMSTSCYQLSYSHSSLPVDFINKL